MLQLTPSNKRANNKRLRKHRMLRFTPGRNAQLLLPRTSLSFRKSNNARRGYPSLTPVGAFPFANARRSRVSSLENFSLYQSRSGRQHLRSRKISRDQIKTTKLIQNVARMSLYSSRQRRLYKSMYASMRTPQFARQKRKKKALMFKHRRAIKKRALLRIFRARIKQLRYLHKKRTAVLADRRTY